MPCLVARNTVFAGGSFWEIGGEACRSLAAFPLLAVPPRIDPASVTKLADGRFTFRITATEGSQVTISASSNLLNWQLLGPAPVASGSAQFTDSTAPKHPLRYYRATVP